MSCPDYELWNSLQGEAVDALYSAFLAGKNPALQAATGAGKTRIGALLTKRLLQHGRVLIVCPTVEIADSFADEVFDVVGCDVGREQSGYDPSAGEPVVVATLASLGRDYESDRMKRLPAREFAAVLFDEADGNTLSNSTTRNIARWFGASTIGGKRSYGPTRMIGISATWVRHDGVSLTGTHGLFDDIVYDIDRDVLVEAGILVPLQQDIENVDLIVPLTPSGEVDSEAWGQALSNEEYLDRVCDYYLFRYFDRQAIAFCPSINYALALCKRLTERGAFATCVFGDTPVDERMMIFDGLRCGMYHIVCVKDCFTRGSNIPSLSLALHLDATRSNARRIQRAGRVARSWVPGEDWFGRHLGLRDVKPDAIEVDFVGVCALPLAMPPSLLSDKVVKDVDDRPVSTKAPTKHTAEAHSLQKVRGVKLAEEYSWAKRRNGWVMSTHKGEIEVYSVVTEWVVEFDGHKDTFSSKRDAFSAAAIILRGIHPALRSAPPKDENDARQRLASMLALCEPEGSE